MPPAEPIEAELESFREQLQGIVAKPYLNDDSELLDALDKAQSTFSKYVLDSFAEDNQSQFTLAQPERKLSPGEVIDRVWLDIHHPTVKAFQKQFFYLNKDARRRRQGSNGGNSSSASRNRTAPVEVRKLFDLFVRFISKCFEFYLQLLKELLARFDLSVYIPVKKLWSTLKEDEASYSMSAAIAKRKIPPADQVSQLVYAIHRCVLYIGDLSRYRTLVAKTYLPSTAISKEDNNNYSKSIELYKLSLLILPSLCDPYNHIAIIDNFKDDKFNVVYNFVRSSLTSSSLSVGFSNLLSLLTKQPKSNSIMRRFEAQNALDRATITKNDRLELLKLEFLILFNYYLLPSKWKVKESYLIKNYNIDDIENDFYRMLGALDFHKQIFNDFYFKQLVILMGGFEMLIDRKMVHPDLKQTQPVISDYLDFMSRYLLTFMKVVLLNWKKDTTSTNISTSLLPVLRLMLCWLKERELARRLLLSDRACSNTLAELVNKVTEYFRTNSNVLDEMECFKTVSRETLFDKRPVRRRLFKEDVTLKEFKPINFYLSDFDDDHLYQKSEAATLALIGELPNESHKSMKLNDNLLRLVAIGVLGRQIVSQNKVGIVFDDNTGMFKTVPVDLTLTTSSAVPAASPSARPAAMEVDPRRKRQTARMAVYKQRFQEDTNGFEDSLLAAEAHRKESGPDVSKYVDMVASLVGERDPTAISSSTSSLSSAASPTPTVLSGKSNGTLRTPLSSGSSAAPLLSNSIWSSGGKNSSQSSLTGPASAALGSSHQQQQKPMQLNPLLFQYNNMGSYPYNNTGYQQSYPLGGNTMQPLSNMNMAVNQMMMGNPTQQSSLGSVNMNQPLFDNSKNQGQRRQRDFLSDDPSHFGSAF